MSGCDWQAPAAIKNGEAMFAKLLANSSNKSSDDEPSPIGKETPRKDSASPATRLHERPWGDKLGIGYQAIPTPLPAEQEQEQEWINPPLTGKLAELDALQAKQWRIPPNEPGYVRRQRKHEEELERQAAEARKKADEAKLEQQAAEAQKKADEAKLEQEAAEAQKKADEAKLEQARLNFEEVQANFDKAYPASKAQVAKMHPQQSTSGANPTPRIATPPPVVPPFISYDGPIEWYNPKPILDHSCLPPRPALGGPSEAKPGVKKDETQYKTKSTAESRFKKIFTPVPSSRDEAWKWPPLEAAFVPAGSYQTQRELPGQATDLNQPHHIQESTQVRAQLAEREKAATPHRNTSTRYMLTIEALAQFEAEGPRSEYNPLQDPTRIAAPVPDHDYEPSIRSLTSGSSSLGISDAGVGEEPTESPSGSSKPDIPDIRNIIAPEHILQDWGGKWIKNTWAGDGRDHSNEILQNVNFLNPFVQGWRESLPSFPTATFFDEPEKEHWFCDVDTFTGDLMEPLPQPHSMVNQATIDPQLTWRQENWTTSFYIRRNIEMVRRRKNKGQHPRMAPPGQIKGRSNHHEVIENESKTTVEKPKSEHLAPDVPKIALHLRPATEADIPQIIDIYNWEIDHGQQVWDIQPLTLDRGIAILNMTKKCCMQFIVAVNAKYDEVYLNAALARGHDKQEQDDRAEKIVGFTFASVWGTGIAGSWNGTARLSGKIHLYVHHEHRRKNVGFNLLDKILSSVSSCYTGRLNCDFVNPGNNGLYRPPHYHERQFYRVVVEILHKHKGRMPGDDPNKLEPDADLEWMEKWLTDEFGFTKTAIFRCFHRTSPSAPGGPEWLDQVTYELPCFRDSTDIPKQL